MNSNELGKRNKPSGDLDKSPKSQKSFSGGHMNQLQLLKLKALENKSKDVVKGSNSNTINTQNNNNYVHQNNRGRGASNQKRGRGNNVRGGQDYNSTRGGFNNQQTSNNLPVHQNLDKKFEEKTPTAQPKTQETQKIVEKPNEIPANIQEEQTNVVETNNLKLNVEVEVLKETHSKDPELKSFVENSDISSGKFENIVNTYNIVSKKFVECLTLTDDSLAKSYKLKFLNTLQEELTNLKKVGDFEVNIEILLKELLVLIRKICMFDDSKLTVKCLNLALGLYPISTLKSSKI